MAKLQNLRFLIFMIIIIIALLAYIMVNRWTIVATSAGDEAYKINRITGSTYYIYKTKEIKVSPLD